MKKRYVATIYKTDGTTLKVRPRVRNGFSTHELQSAVDGYIEMVQSGIKGCRQMFANENGKLLLLRPNPHTQKIVDMRIYTINGYGPHWRIAGDVIAVYREEISDEHLVELPIIRLSTTVRL